MSRHKHSGDRTFMLTLETALVKVQAAADNAPVSYTHGLRNRKRERLT
jgi:hypothetical protein